MRQRFVCALLVLCMVISLLPISVLASTGTNITGFIAPIDNPDASAIKVSTAEELSSIRNNLYGSYVLTRDIDLSSYGNWEPIGTTLSEAFHGVLDGQGHRIIGLTVSEEMTAGTLKAPSYVSGLFGVLDGAQIKNIQFENAEVSISTTSGYNYSSNVDSDHSIFAGIIAGYTKNNTVIYNCFSSGSVSAKAYEEGCSNSYAGGLVGCAQKTILSYSYNTASVRGYNGNAVQAYHTYAGGLAGAMESVGTIDRSYNGGAVSAQTLDYGDPFCGGLVGATIKAAINITDSFNEGSVQSVSGNMFCGTPYAGGICGSFAGSIDRVYNSGTVTANTKDQYVINSTTAYAGGICAKSTSLSTINNSAVVVAKVSASATGNKYQYRISSQGTKSNNITSSQVTSGSTNDANLTIDISVMKSADVFAYQLGWNFSTVWTMASGKDFPQLKQVDVKSDEYNQEYIDQHLAFIDGSVYRDFQNDHRWAQMIWSERNNLMANTGERLYNVLADGTEVFNDICQLELGSAVKDLFSEDNLFEILLADYITNQGTGTEIIELTKLEVPLSMDKAYSKLESLIRKHWDSEKWGELSDEDLFWLYHYGDKPAEDWINEDFNEHLSEIVYDTKHDGDGLAAILGVTTGAIDLILDGKQHIDDIIDWLNGLLKRAAEVNAYLSADEDFQAVLAEITQHLPDTTSEERTFKKELSEALDDYIRYCQADPETVSEKVFVDYIMDSATEKLDDAVFDFIDNKTNKWLTFILPSAVIAKLKVVGAIVDGTWNVLLYVTNLGEIADCRAMLRINAYFEQAMYQTLKTMESNFLSVPSLENACRFDAAFKFLKEVEICSIDIETEYMRNSQASWVNAVINCSNSYMNSSIQEAQLCKLFLNKMYCHGTTYTLGGKVITIACPTDVSLYDESGTLVAAVKNNSVTKCDEGILAYTADAVKLFVVPMDQDYGVKIDATGNGTMTYSVSEYDSNLENVQTAVCSDIEIKKGETYTGTVNKELETELESYVLNSSDDTVINSFEVVNEENNVPVESVSIDSDENCVVLNIGDNKKMNAVILPSNATNRTLVWTTSNESVLSVSEDGTVTAKSGGTATVTAHSIYGGASASVTYVVLTEGRSLYITGQPMSADYLVEDTPQPLSVSCYNSGEETAAIQWYSATQKDLSDGKPLAGETAQQLVPDTSVPGTRYYYTVITCGRETETTSAARVSVYEKPLLASGETENGLSWQLNGNYTLTVSGTGDMDSFSSEKAVPWDSYRSEIRRIVIDGSVSSVSKSAFTNCSAATEIIVSDSVTSIDAGAFGGCASLQEISIPFVGTASDAVDSNAVFGSIFGIISSGGTIQYYKLNGSSLSGYRYAVPESLRRVTISNAVSIPFGAFYNCNNITDITLNDGINTISAYSFRNCSGLTGLVIPNSVAYIAEGALNGCNSLTVLSVPFVGANRDINGTYESAFGLIFGRATTSDTHYYSQYPIVNGTSLSGYSYVVPASLNEIRITDAKQIPDGAFSNLSDLITLHLNSAIMSIGSYAFYQTNGLTDIYYQGPEISWNAISVNSGNDLLNKTSIHFLDDEKISVTYSYDPKSFELTFFCSGDLISTNVCFATYDVKGKLISCQTVKNEEYSVVLDKQVSYAKLFFFDNVTNAPVRSAFHFDLGQV